MRFGKLKTLFRKPQKTFTGLCLIVKKFSALQTNLKIRPSPTRPATTFVASFIGSPPMNLLRDAPDARPGTIVGIRPEHLP